MTMTMTVSQSVSQYVFVSSPPDITPSLKIAAWKLLSWLCGAPYLTRGRVCNLQCRTGNLTLLSHLRFPQPGGPGSRVYISQEQGGPIMPLGTGIPLRRLLRLAGLR
jgi:hypothetical protein